MNFAGPVGRTGPGVAGAHEPPGGEKLRGYGAECGRRAATITAAHGGWRKGMYELSNGCGISNQRPPMPG